MICTALRHATGREPSRESAASPPDPDPMPPAPDSPRAVIRFPFRNRRPMQ